MNRPEARWTQTGWGRAPNCAKWLDYPSAHARITVEIPWHQWSAEPPQQTKHIVDDTSASAHLKLMIFTSTVLKCLSDLIFGPGESSSVPASPSRADVLCTGWDWPLGALLPASSAFISSSCSVKADRFNVLEMTQIYTIRIAALLLDENGSTLTTSGSKCK